jgi:hypothetical protein
MANYVPPVKSLRRDEPVSPTSEQHLQAPQAINIETSEEINSLLPCENRQQSESYSNDHHRLPDDIERKIPDASSVALPKSSCIVWMVFIYSSLALTAWILICLLTFKPLTTKRYGFDYREQVNQTKFVKSEVIYRVARTVQAVVGVLTIPLTSAVCSAAAVVFAQTNRWERKLTMRQTITLADKGWTDPATIIKLLSGNGKK